MILTCQKLTVQLLYNWGHLDKYYFPSLHGCQCFSKFPLWVQSVNTFSNASYWGCFPLTKLNKFLSNSSKTVIREVICQKRVRVFHQGFQTPRNRWKHEAAGWVLLLFQGVWNPWWNTKHKFLTWLLKLVWELIVELFLKNRWLEDVLNRLFFVSYSW